MNVDDLPEALSAAVLRFCEENIQYDGHLSIHGSLTLIADSATTVAFFSKKLKEDSGMTCMYEISSFLAKMI